MASRIGEPVIASHLKDRLSSYLETGELPTQEDGEVVKALLEMDTILVQQQSSQMVIGDS